MHNDSVEGVRERDGESVRCPFAGARVRSDAERATGDPAQDTASRDREDADASAGAPSSGQYRYGRFAGLRRQLRGVSPFEGDITPSRVRLVAFRAGRPTLPFPHPWNYTEPIRILDTYFHGADEETGPGRHNRYLEVPGFAPVLVTRDPGLIRAISVETGAKPGQFDRDTMPSAGIARATGADTLLYANGPQWKRQKQLSTPPFSRTSLFQPEQFGEFEATFRATVHQRLGALRERIAREGEPVEVRLEPEIKAVMLELLVNCFFGADVPYDEIRARFVPALETVIDDIVLDTVVNKIGVPLGFVPSLSRRLARAKRARRDFERLTDIALSGRPEGRAQWSRFRSEAPDDALRSNIRVFLAGALEATTSYASWAISHLSRNAAAQETLHNEVASIDAYTPDVLRDTAWLGRVLDETLRLSPALYFHPRRPTDDTWVETLAGARLKIAAGTHVLLDVWHANRHEDHWGVGVTGFPADAFAPERWDAIASCGRDAREMLHFGFGHGPRFCPGKHLGQLEVALVVGALVKLFAFEAVEPESGVRAGVSTKPADGVRVRIRIR